MLLAWITFVDLCLLFLIWVVQLKVYPSFRVKNEQNFTLWHARYRQTMAYIAGPLMILQLCGAFLLSIASPSVVNALYLTLALSAWGITFGLAVPIHNTLQAMGNQDRIVNRLISINWLRTGVWSLTAGLAFAR